MRTVKFVIKVAAVLFALCVLKSCCSFFRSCECDETPIPFILNRLNINNLDNSGTYASVTESDTMCTSAVAFEILINDTSLYYPYYSNSQLQRAPFGFSSAWAEECEPGFTSNEKIERIEIYSLFDLNENIFADDEVSAFFYGQSDYYPSSGMYASLSDVISYLNSLASYYPQLTFKVFLSKPIENNRARFLFNVFLSDGRILSDTTRLITVVPG